MVSSGISVASEKILIDCMNHIKSIRGRMTMKRLSRTRHSASENINYNNINCVGIEWLNWSLKF